MNILYIDDNEINRKVLQIMLESRQIDMVSAASGEEGLALAAAQPFDLIFVDLRMPKIDGLEVVRRLRADARHSDDRNIVIITADVSPETEQACYRAGTDAVLHKPVSMVDLFALVDRWTPDD
ncbi:response regulator [Pacificimonas sp. ICDLI1SI03]